MHNHIGDRDYYFSSSDEPHWVIAEQDYPDPGSFVVYYDNKTGSFEVTLAESLKEERAIASRFPSRWPGTVHVYTEGALANPHDPDGRVRVSQKKVPPNGLSWSKTLHLSKLPLGTKVRIFSGQIKWLFVQQADSRSSTEVYEDEVQTRPHEVSSFARAIARST